MIMNKKGQEESTGNIVKAVIAAFVLVIVILGIWMFYSGKLPFFEGLPGFNQTKQGVADLEIFRYQILNDNLQYYDGTTWVDFKAGQTIEVNGKKIEESSINDDIIFNYIGQKNYDLLANGVVIVSSASYIDGTVSIPGGNVVIGVKGYPALYLKLDSNDVFKLDAGELKKVENSEFENNNFPYFLKPGSDVIKNIMVWRDSLINSPVTIGYTDRGGASQQIITCYQKNKYETDKELVIDLSKPLQEGQSCPYP